MSDRKRKTPPGLIAALILLVSLLAGVFYVSPLTDQVEFLEQQVLVEESKLADLNKRLNDLKALEASLPKSELAKQQLLATVPIGVNQDDLILDFERLAEENDIAFDSLSFGLGSATELGDSVHLVNVTSTFRGTEQTLIRFLESLETNPRKIMVDSISVSLDKSSSADIDAAVSFSLNMRAFYQE